MSEFVERNGDLLADDADALVNPVNCVGVMGAGLALAFKRRWPEMYADYRHCCDRGVMDPGGLHLWSHDDGPLVISLPTKHHWRERSSLSIIEGGLRSLRSLLTQVDQRVRSIAVPALGCGNGGLDWRDVEPLIRAWLHDIDDLEVRLYPPQGTPRRYPPTSHAADTDAYHNALHGR